MTARPGRPTVAFNGRFLTRPQSGVQRVAGQMLRAIDRQLDQAPSVGPNIELVCPNRADTAPLDMHAISVRHSGSAKGNLAWEQLHLPLVSRHEILVNLCNTGPLMSTGGIVMMHDAQVYLSPESYSPAFVSWYRFAAPQLGRRAARVLTVSEFSKSMLVKHGVVEESKIRVIHNGVDHLKTVVADPDVVARLGLPPKGFVLAMSSSQAHKNVRVLLRAFAHPSLANVPLVLYGSRPSRFSGEILPNVVFTGRVSDTELKALIQAAVVFAFPSKTEGFGLPPLEAMSLGCPAVVAPRGALPEICGDAALYADPDDSAAWVEVIRHLLDDTKAHAQWSARAIERASSFEWSNSAAKLLKIIDEVAEGG